MLVALVFILVDTHDDCLDAAFCGSGDDDLLGSCLQVALSLFLLGEEAGRLDDIVDTEFLPGKLCG